MTVQALSLAQMLSEGLDLCVRAKRLDADMMATLAFPGREEMTRSATPALWIQDQYDRDLNDWEARARKLLLESGLASRVKPRR